MSDDPKVWYVRPVFFVSDCAASLRFYDALGFRESWRSEEHGHIHVVQVTRNDFELILCERGDRPSSGRLFFSLYAEELERFLATCSAAGIAVRDDNWGMPVKVVNDPDGNDLLFSID